MHKTENLHITLPEGVNSIQTKYINSTKKKNVHTSGMNSSGQAQALVKIAQLPLPQWLTLPGQRGQRQTQNKSTQHLQGMAFPLLSSSYFISHVHQEAQRTQVHPDGCPLSKNNVLFFFSALGLRAPKGLAKPATELCTLFEPLQQLTQ